MKRIVICCDGTWNEPDHSRNGHPCPTNVVKLASLVPPMGRDGVAQRVFYHNGIGSMASRTKRLIDGATGYGISRILLACYQWLVRTFEPGDQLFLFGFSRGAYTARSLAGFVRNSGILRPENESLLTEAFALYRSRSGDRTPRAVASRLFRQNYGWQDLTPIRCIGVWDTVGSLGIPNTFLQGVLKHVFRVNREFHDTDLSALVDFAFHAMAVDERRRPFRATLWNQTPQGRAAGQVLEQQWFPGTHSDIGGGNPDPGLSGVTLDWMIAGARRAGLDVHDADRLGPPTFPAHRPDPLGPVHPSMTALYRLMGPIVRDVCRTTGDGEALADATRTRWAATDWRPEALLDLKRRDPAALQP